MCFFFLPSFVFIRTYVYFISSINFSISLVFLYIFSQWENTRYRLEVCVLEIQCYSQCCMCILVHYFRKVKPCCSFSSFIFLSCISYCLVYLSQYDKINYYGTHTHTYIQVNSTKSQVNHLVFILLRMQINWLFFFSSFILYFILHCFHGFIPCHLSSSFLYPKFSSLPVISSHLHLHHSSSPFSDNSYSFLFHLPSYLHFLSVFQTYSISPYITLLFSPQLFFPSLIYTCLNHLLFFLQWTAWILAVVGMGGVWRVGVCVALGGRMLTALRQITKCLHASQTVQDTASTTFITLPACVRASGLDLTARKVRMMFFLYFHRLFGLSTVGNVQSSSG